MLKAKTPAFCVEITSGQPLSDPSKGYSSFCVQDLSEGSDSFCARRFAQRRPGPTVACYRPGRWGDSTLAGY